MKRIVSILLTASMVAFTAVAGLTSTGITANAEGTVTSVYTGEQVPASSAGERPIAVMVPTDKAAQPSYGISHAKVLYEIMEEGGISRQLAIIDDWQNLDRIGNIRSCRKYYIHLATEWDPILIHAGGVVYMKDRITKSDINNISSAAMYGTGGKAPGSASFFRAKDRKAPHNTYISADGIREAAEKLGYSLNTRPQYANSKHFSFTVDANTLEQYTDAQSANTIDLKNVFSYTKSKLVYNPATGLYDKYLHGKAQVDGTNGEQLAFANVIIQTTNWRQKDKKGYLEFDVIGSGEGYYCTKGRAIHVTWNKTDDYKPTTYYDDMGNEIILNTGKTYIAVAQSGKAPVFE